MYQSLALLLLAFCFSNICSAAESHKYVSYDEEHGVYLAKGKPIIWIYWNHNMPTLIQMSIASIFCHNHPDFSIILINETLIHLWIPDMHPSFKHLTPNHQGDYFRMRILDIYGGIYVDADTIGMRSWKEEYDQLKDFDLVNADWAPDGDQVSIPVVGPIRARSKLSQEWVRIMHAKLDEVLPKLEERQKNPSIPYPLEWAAVCLFNVRAAYKVVEKDASFRYKKYSGTDTFGQLVFKGLYGFEETKTLKTPITIKSTPGLYYHNSVLSGDRREWSVRKLMESAVVFGEVFRQTFDSCHNGNRNLFDFTIDANSNANRNVDEAVKYAESLIQSLLD